MSLQSSFGIEIHRTQLTVPLVDSISIRTEVTEWQRVDQRFVSPTLVLAIDAKEMLFSYYQCVGNI